ncbi:MAG: inorganic phosphate transporter [Nitrososphaeria archaeon]
MNLIEILDLIFLILLIYLFGLNNGAVFEGGLAGSAGFNYSIAAITVGLGILLGTLLQGEYTARYAKTLGTMGTIYGLILLIIQIILFYAFTAVKLPLSITQSLVGGWLAILIVEGTKHISENVSWLFLWWIISPFIALAFSAVLYKALRRLLFKLTISTLSTIIRISALITVFYTSFVLGANNVGFIAGAYSLSYLEIAVLAVFASLGALKAAGMSKAVGEDLIVVGPIGIISAVLGGATILLVLTYLGLPASLTTVTMGGLIGVGFSSKPRIFKSNYLKWVILSWILAFLLGFAAVYVLLIVLKPIIFFALC